MYRSSTVKYLRQHSSSSKAADKRRQKKLMNGLLGSFLLENFDDFFDDYKSKNTLSHEALTAIDHFLQALNDFFDLHEDLTEEMVAKNTEIQWYSYANISNGDYIRAKSMYYNEPSFSDVSINMSDDETNEYNTDAGACFGKVCYSIEF